MGAETLIIDRHFSVDNGFADHNCFVRIDDFLGQTTLNTVTCENDTVLRIWCPFDKQLATRSVLQHTGRSNDYQWCCSLGDCVQFVVLLEFEGVLAALKLHAQLVTHQVSVRVED